MWPLQKNPGLLREGRDSAAFLKRKAAQPERAWERRLPSRCGAATKTSSRLQGCQRSQTSAKNRAEMHLSRKNDPQSGLPAADNRNIVGRMTPDRSNHREVIPTEDVARTVDGEHADRNAP